MSPRQSKFISPLSLTLYLSLGLFLTRCVRPLDDASLARDVRWQFDTIRKCLVVSHRVLGYLVVGASWSRAAALSEFVILHCIRLVVLHDFKGIAVHTLLLSNAVGIIVHGTKFYLK